MPDVDAAFERALAAGAKSLAAPEDRVYGERAGFVEDPFGNHWYIATHLGPSPVPAGHRMVTPFVHPRGVTSYIEFLSRALGDRPDEAGGLTPLGKKAVGELNRLGVVIDAAQLTPNGVRQTLALTRAPVVASHSGIRGIGSMSRVER